VPGKKITDQQVRKYKEARRQATQWSPSALSRIMTLMAARCGGVIGQLATKTRTMTSRPGAIHDERRDGTMPRPRCHATPGIVWHTRN